MQEALLQMCENSPARQQLPQKMTPPTQNPSTQIELMFDGFDEVSRENFDLANECLDTLKRNFNGAIRVWVTTRPQHLHKLEKSFSVLGYNIQAFQEKHQIDFLISFWNRPGIKLDEDKLQSFSDTCLKTLKEKLNKKDEDIAGIPLQCMMIAEIYMQDAHRFCDSKNKEVQNCPEGPTSTNINSIGDLYEKMIAYKIEKFIGTYPLITEEIRNIWPLHTYLALELIFPSHAHKFKDILQIGSALKPDYLVNIRILERRGNTSEYPARFIHRTFAEYLVARFFVLYEISHITADLQNPNQGDLDFLFEHALKCEPHHRNSFAHPVVCHFLDVLLGSQTHTPTAKSISEKSTNCVKNVVYDCIHSDFGNIIKFLHSLKYPESFCIKDIFYSESTIFIDATKTVSLDLLKFLLQRFEHEPLTKIKVEHDPRTPLHAAVCRGNYTIFEYILKGHHFEDLVKEDEEFLDLMCLAVEDTLDGDLDEIQDRAQIVTTLCNFNQEMLDFCGGRGVTLLFANKVNIKLLKTLIECGPNLFHFDNTFRFDTIFHRATKYLSASDYYYLLQSTPKTTLNALLQMDCAFYQPILHLIVKNGLATPNILQLILSNGVDINTRNKNDQTCIFSAMRMTIQDMILPTVKLLLENGADYTRVDSDGNNILHYCATWGRNDCLQFFLEEKNMNVNRINNIGDTPIFKVVLQFRVLTPGLEAVKFLLERGADYNILNKYQCNLLHYASYGGQLECLQFLLSLGGLDVNLANDDGNTPILCAPYFVSSKVLEMIRLLLANGADHKRVNSDGNGIVHISAWRERIECLGFFLEEKKMNVNQINNNGETPIFYALSNEKSVLETVEFLIKQGADHKILNSNQNNVLHQAASNGQLECLQLFLSLGGLDINLVNEDGDTPLMCALQQYHWNALAMIKRLLGQCADHKISNKKENNVLHLAAQSGNADCIGHFAGLPSLDVNARNCDKDTPLHLGIKNIDNYFPRSDDFKSLLHTIEILLSVGADVNAKDYHGKTPLDLYQEKLLTSEFKEELMKKDLEIRSLLEG